LRERERERKRRRRRRRDRDLSEDLLFLKGWKTLPRSNNLKLDESHILYI
jgi:hypothetical protein